MVPSDVHLADTHHHPPGSSHPDASHLADHRSTPFLPPFPPASPSSQLYAPPTSIAGQQAPVARHSGIRLDLGVDGRPQGMGASEGLMGERRMSGAEGGGGQGLGGPRGMVVGAQYGGVMEGTHGQGQGGAQQYQPYMPIASTSSSPSPFPPGANAQPFPMSYPTNYPQQSPIHSPILQPQHYHPQYQQPYTNYQQLPLQSQLSVPPGYAQPMMDPSAGAMYAPPGAQLGHPGAHAQMQQQAMPYPIAPAFATQGGTFYFMPRQQQQQQQQQTGPPPPPSQPQYPSVQPPPPLLPGQGLGMYTLPLQNGHASGSSRSPMMASGLAMSLPLSANSSTSSLTPTGTTTSTSTHTTAGTKRPPSDPSDPSAPAPAPRPKPKKKKTKSARDQPKRFICDFGGCGRAFARQFNLQTHAKSHLNIRDYDCAHCDKKFSRRHDRGRHCAAVHPEAVNEDLGGRGGRDGEGEEEGSGEEYPDVSGLVLP